MCYILFLFTHAVRGTSGIVQKDANFKDIKKKNQESKVIFCSVIIYCPELLYFIFPRLCCDSAI